MDYCELHLHTCFSLLDGASAPEDLIARAREIGLPALAITDHDNLYAASTFWREAHSAGIKPIIGAEVTVAADPTADPAADPAAYPKEDHHLTLLARDRTGYANLCRLLTRAHLAGTKGRPRLEFSQLRQFSPGLSCLSGCRRGRLSSLLLAGRKDEARRWAGLLMDTFGPNFWIELQNHLRPEDKLLNHRLVQLAKQLDIGYLATNNVHYATRHGHRLQDVLTCIRHRTTLEESAGLRYPNSELFLKSAREMAAIFPEHPEAIGNTIYLAEQCHLDLDFTLYRFPRYPLPAGQNPDDYLEALCRSRVRERYCDSDGKAHVWLREELDLIRHLGLADYFLVVWDIMEFARRSGILAQGRGSAANSLVAYLLGITRVDPIRERLFLGRFLNEEMTSMPDIDIDIASDRRDEVIDYVYRKYGEEYAAMACTYITFQGRNAVREVGKALGWPDPLLDRMAKSVTAYDARQLEADLGGIEEFKPYLSSPAGQEFLDLCRQIADFPRHLSIHVGAMVISCRPLSELVPLERAAMPGRVVCQWDKDGIAAAGLIKIDLLGLRMLSLISEALALAGESRGKSMTRQSIPPDDPAVFDLISRADTLGVFQVESRAQAQALPAVKPRSLADLTIQVALIRPGPLQGNMVHPYLRRRHGQEEVTFPYPRLRPILEETLGIILFQEQALQVACAIANFTPGEAEGLRRAMSQKRSRTAMARFRQRFLEGAARNGVAPEAAERIFQQLEAFGQYGFCKSHAVGFALLTYESAWLKLHHPAQFYAALLNNQPMGFYPPEVIVGDAKRHGVTILPVDINRSHFRCLIEEGKVRLGFRFVKGVGETTAGVIARERQKGPYASLGDFYRRTSSHRETVDRQTVENLILVGAFDAFGQRRHLLWELGLLTRLPPAGLPLSLPEVEVTLPPLPTEGETLLEYQLQGLSCRQHILEAFRPSLSSPRPFRSHQRPAAKSGEGGCCEVYRVRDLAHFANGTRVRLAGCVVARQAPPTAKGHVFLTVEDETGLADVILKPTVYQKYRQVVRLEPLLLVEGILQKRGGTTNLIATYLAPLQSFLTGGGTPPPSQSSS